MDPTKKELYGAKRSSGINCSDPLIQTSWGMVRADDDPTTWLLLGYADPSTIQVVSSGDSIDELLAQLNDDSIFFGVFRAVIAESVKFFSVSV